MPRQARKKSSTRTYHVVIKGADRQLLFEDVDDYVKYLDFLAYYNVRNNLSSIEYSICDMV